jgi:hypothetical protein
LSVAAAKAALAGDRTGTPKGRDGQVEALRNLRVAARYRVVLCRLRWDHRTRKYMQRRTKDGLSKNEIIRCLKRYIARELYQLITTNDLQPTS